MQRGDFGDLYVQIKTEVPVYLNKRTKRILEKFRKIENESSNPSIKKFFKKLKDFWKNKFIFRLSKIIFKLMINIAS